MVIPLKKVNYKSLDNFFKVLLYCLKSLTNICKTKNNLCSNLRKLPFMSKKLPFVRLLLKYVEKCVIMRNKKFYMLILLRGCLTNKISFCFDIAT